MSTSETSPGLDVRVFASCEYLQSGLCLSANSVRACAILRAGGGEPPLVEPYTGAPLSLEQIESARSEIVRQNRAGGYPACRGCDHLVERAWVAPSHPVRWLGLTNWLACNLECDYCWLQRDGGAERVRKGEIPPSSYDVAVIVSQLLDKGWLAPDATVDWGGGGEPTTMPGFDELLLRLHNHGVVQWLHTNAVRLPRAVAENHVHGPRLRLLCSVDAGTPETYQAMKQRDALAKVWEHLAAYADRGVSVTAKYIVTERNCSREEIDAFVQAAVAHGRPEIRGDIDYAQPEQSPAVVAGLAYLQWSCHIEGLGCAICGVGVGYAPDSELATRVQKAVAQLAGYSQLNWRGRLGVALVDRIAKLLRLK